MLVGVITSVTVSSLWFRKYLKQKQAEAFFGYYAKLSLLLKALCNKLEENGRLNISNHEEGNIYSLMYTNATEFCPSYSTPSKIELDLYRADAERIKNLLLANDNNVYPPGSRRKEWYESQHVLLSFCEFLENDAYWHSTNQKFANNGDEPKHIKKCKLLVEAINYIETSINNAKY